MNYEDDIRIDDQMLDVEWLEQPEKMLKYAQIAARARLDLDLAKEKVDVVKAELDRAIRSDPASYGIEKITETAVQNMIIIQPTYVTANNAMIQLKYEADMAQGAVRAIDARKDALENLVRLHGQSYFAGPRVPHDDLAALRERKKSKITPHITTITRTT
jgi:hypothetical protein